MDPKQCWKAVPQLAAIIGPAVLCCTAFVQSADITGWEKLPWGTSKSAALKALQSLHLHECRRTAACADELMIDDYRLNGVSYEVELTFVPKYGLGRVTMTADDERDAFRKALSELTVRYGKPGLQSEYDGAREVTRARWTWVTRHGKLSLASEDGTSGVFTITYEAHRALP